MSNERASITEVLTKEAKLKCQNCEKVFNSVQNLSYHTKTKHEGVKYACNQCDQQFTTQSNLSAHIKSKHKGVKYACNQCDYQATQQGNLRTHVQFIHDKSVHHYYVCNQCKQKFTRHGSLINHLRRKHTEQITRKHSKWEKSGEVSCPECGISFSSNNEMEAHFLKVHDKV